MALRYVFLNVKEFTILQILVSGALEAISLNYIAVVMVTVLPVNPDVIVLLMCSLSVAPAIWQAFKSRSQWQTCQGKLDVIKFSAAAISAITGIVMLSIKVTNHKISFSLYEMKARM